MAIKVYPGAANPSHQISLSDGVESWGLRLDGGEQAVQEIPLTPSTLPFRDGLSSFGEWEPGMASIEQRSWHGGRGLDIFLANDKVAATRFYDSMNAWTLTPGHLMPAPQWRMAKGLKAGIQHLPGDVNWKSLFDEQSYLATSFMVGGDDVTAAKVSLWLRRVGSPGEMTLMIHADDGAGKPGSSLSGAGETITAASLTDVVSVFKSFDASGYGGVLDADTQYHLVVSGSETDNTANHWQVGVDLGGSGAHASADGADWDALDYGLYFYVTEARNRRDFHFFQMKGTLYAADQHFDGAPSHLYMNGDRGVATAGGTISLEDSDKAWEIDQWANAWVKIVEGKGVGQSRQILANSAIELTVTGWEIQPDTTSEYVIHSTDYWSDISPSSGDLIDGVIQGVAVINNQAHFAQGGATFILKMRFNPSASPPQHQFDDDGSKAEFLHTFHHSLDGPQMWRGRAASCEISRSAPVGWLTDMTYGSAIPVGDDSQRLLGLIDIGGALWVLKEDGLWRVDDDDRVQGFALDLPVRGSDRQPIAIHGGELYFGWDGAVMRYSGGKAIDIGPSGELGLPAGRGGHVTAIQSLGPWLAIAVDAGAEGQSSVLVWDGAGWHELLRAPEVGEQIQGLQWQVCPGSRPRLWISLTDNMVSMELPKHTSNPLGDVGLAFQHEALLEQRIVDMGVTRLPKFLKDVGMVSQNLRTGVEVHLDYQLDGDIGGSHWRTAGTFYSSPLDSVGVNSGQVHAIQTRLRLMSNQATEPPVVRSTVLEGFARTPLKYQWVLRVKVADLQRNASGGLDPDPDAFMQWLKRAAREARKIRMRAVWEALDDKYVIVEPPTLMRQFSNSLLNWWGGTASIVLREA